MRRVILATPAHDHRVHVEFTYSLIQTVRALAARGISAHPVFWPGEALVQRARNELMRCAIESGVDDVLFIDGDQEWQPEAAMALLDHPVDVVGIPIRKKTDDRELYNVRAVNELVRDPDTGLYEVDAVGTGFLRLSRAATTAAWELSEEYEDADHTCRMVFDVRVIDGKLVGEDTVFCMKLKAAGFPIYIDPNHEIGHFGTKKYQGNFADWYERYYKHEKEPLATEGAVG